MKDSQLETLIKNVKPESDRRQVKAESPEATSRSESPNNIGARNLPEINDKSFERIFKFQT
jgi:hypothetical protein